MEYGLLGPFRVLDDEGAEVQPSAPKLRTLLASHPAQLDTRGGRSPRTRSPIHLPGHVADEELGERFKSSATPQSN